MHGTRIPPYPFLSRREIGFHCAWDADPSMPVSESKRNSDSESDMSALIENILSCAWYADRGGQQTRASSACTMQVCHGPVDRRDKRYHDLMPGSDTVTVLVHAQYRYVKVLQIEDIKNMTISCQALTRSRSLSLCMHSKDMTLLK